MYRYMYTNSPAGAAFESQNFIWKTLGDHFGGPGSILVARGVPWTPEVTFGRQMLFFCPLLVDFGCTWGITLESF